MKMFIGQRLNARSIFKEFLVCVLQVCDPDEVLISSGFYSNEFWNCDPRLISLLRNKNITLSGQQQYIRRLNAELATVLGPSSNVTSQILPLLPSDPAWHKNEIHFIKDDKTIAIIMGSSSCTARDLDQDFTDPTKPPYNINTDILICSDSNAEDIGNNLREMDIPIPQVNILDSLTATTKRQIGI